MATKIKINIFKTPIIVLTLFGIMTFTIMVIILNGKSIKHLDSYISNLPNEESINASLKNYEIIQEEIKNNYYSGNYLRAISNAMDYFRVFESEDEGGGINHWLHLSIILGITKSNICRELIFFNEKDLKLLHLSILKNNIIEYDDFFMDYQIKNRVGYYLEREAALILLFPKLINTRVSIKKKTKLLTKFAKYYPDL